jgi:hypothetical protein
LKKSARLYIYLPPITTRERCSPGTVCNKCYISLPFSERYVTILLQSVSRMATLCNKKSLLHNTVCNNLLHTVSLLHTVPLCRTFNNIINMIFSNYLQTKSNPIELNKEHRHSNWSMTISAILCSTLWIISVVMCHVYLIVRNEGSVFQNEISTLRIHSGHFENSSVMCYTSNCFLMNS